MIEKQSSGSFFPLRECFMFATSGLGIQPKEFWCMGLAELIAFTDGLYKYSESEGELAAAPTKEELRELIKSLEN